ncbi:hypothetical protein GF326_05590 [Candidatus Bathyarchaeota archaeon]|nr:hypothetical protein [Candidatus Bathyarchaeota archaeon]
MPEQVNQLQWLNTRYTAILEDLRNNTTDETTEKILELLEINQQIQAQIMLRLLIEQQELRSDTDTQLMEISHYLQEIILSRSREAENLEKVR